MPAAAAAGGSSVSGGPAGRHSGAAGEASSGCPAPALAAPLHHTSLIVPHIRQESFWDCGLACCLMVLRALGAPPHRFSMPILQALCPTRSVWSIDIAHLLRACGARVTLATITLGANVAYVTERFYAESMVEDEARVTRLFAEAPAAGVGLQQRSLSLEELAALVAAGRHFIIALVDKRKLEEGSLTAAALPPAVVVPIGLPPQGFTGHYIVLTDYDPGTHAFCLRDPAAQAADTWVPAAQLDAARRAFGTDEDILLVDVAPLDAIDLEAALEQRQQLEQADQQKQQQQCQAEDSVPVLSPPSLERTSAPLLL